MILRLLLVRLIVLGRLRPCGRFRIFLVLNHCAGKEEEEEEGDQSGKGDRGKRDRNGKVQGGGGDSERDGGCLPTQQLQMDLWRPLQPCHL